jgi:hypothetical protein
MIDMTRPVAGEEVESAIARDLAKHAAYVAPLTVVALGLWKGWPGAIGAALALALVVANFLAAAALLTWSARISPAAVAGAALGGYVVRIGLITVVGVAVHDQPWLNFAVFGIVLLTAHLGLLAWELRSVSLTLAAPGLHPPKE